MDEVLCALRASRLYAFRSLGRLSLLSLSVRLASSPTAKARGARQGAGGEAAHRPTTTKYMEFLCQVQPQRIQQKRKTARNSPGTAISRENTVSTTCRRKPSRKKASFLTGMRPRISPPPWTPFATSFFATVFLMKGYDADSKITDFTTLYQIGELLSRSLGMLSKTCSVLADYNLMHVRRIPTA